MKDTPLTMCARLAIVLSLLTLILGASAGFTVRGVPVEAPRVILQSRIMGLGSGFTAVDPDTTMFLYLPEWENQSYQITTDGEVIAMGNMTTPLEEIGLPLHGGDVINNLTLNVNGTWIWSMQKVYVIQPRTWAASDFIRDDYFFQVPVEKWDSTLWLQFYATSMGTLISIIFMGWRAMVHYRDRAEPEMMAGGS